MVEVLVEKFDRFDPSQSLCDMTLTPYLLLTLAIFAIYLEPRRLPRIPTVPLWIMCFLLSTVTGTVFGVIDPTVSLLALLPMLAANGFSGQHPVTQTRILKALVVIICLMLALHLVPGFHNLRLLDQVKLRPDAASFTLYANYDKGAAGLILLAWGSRRADSLAAILNNWRTQLTYLIATPIMALGLAWAMGVIHPDPAWPSITPVFLAVNLLFTCVAEEAFFRGWIQGGLARLWQRKSWGEWVAIVIGAMLFGAAHLGGGLAYALVATLAGVMYGRCYVRGSIEHAVLCHFAVNTAHFLLFTYPKVG
ncbi:CPBP family intramembrane metalloprotease [Burkholderiaceae bacterium DAT-1]|nr:CPBP family intramembrane metalloprotease [Burkholderiaceae bacterium DAT-1]